MLRSRVTRSSYIITQRPPHRTLLRGENVAEKKVDFKYIQPGKPSQNAYIEKFNRTFL